MVHIVLQRDSKTASEERLQFRLHLCLFGVCTVVWKQEQSVSNTPNVQKELLEKVNERISSLIIPPEVRFGRLPASMGRSSSLTAEQWMLWVNYYSLNMYLAVPKYRLCMGSIVSIRTVSK